MKTERKKSIPESVKLLGNNIARIIEEKGLLRRTVAHDADLDVENLRKYISGKQIMGVHILFRLAKALDVSVEELCREI